MNGETGQWIPISIGLQKCGCPIEGGRLAADRLTPRRTQMSGSYFRLAAVAFSTVALAACAHDSMKPRHVHVRVGESLGEVTHRFERQHGRVPYELTVVPNGGREGIAIMVVPYSSPEALYTVQSSWLSSHYEFTFEGDFLTEIAWRTQDGSHLAERSLDSVTLVPKFYRGRSQ